MMRKAPLMFAVGLAWIAGSGALAAASGERAAVPKVHRDLVYVRGGHERHKLDLYLPEGAEGPVPLLLWIHGGGWQNGSKENGLPLRQGWTGRGYAVASLNYRLSSHAIFPAQIEDGKAAIRWLRAHAEKYGLDPDRFGVWGSSAGGHLAALVGTTGDAGVFETGDHRDQSSKVQAVCDYYGPTDFTVFASTPGYESHARADSPEAKLLGGAVLEDRERAARANPITYVSPGDPPFLIVHGDKDPVVPIHQSRLLFEALQGVGGEVHFHTIEGAAHGQGFDGQEVGLLVRSFFDRHLLGVDGTAPPAEREAKTSVSQASASAGRPGARAGGMPPGGGRGAGPGMDFEAILSRSDTNRDGKISREEFRGPPALFDRWDTDRDGFVTREEHERGVRPGQAPPANAPGMEEGRSPAGTGADLATGFQLDGERWTYREGEWSMSGVLLKPGGKGPFPAVLISHGMGGSAASFGLTKAREMVKWGLVCMAPDYTHSGGARGAPGPDVGASAENLRRAKTCLELLAHMPEVDAKRLAAYGHSMGGFVTIGLAGTEPDLLRAAAITGSGVAPRAGFPAPAVEVAGKVRTPFLMLHGTADTVVRPEQSASLQEVLERNGVPNERRLFEGEGHPIDQSKREEVFAAIRDWLKRQGVLP